jgi:hypothetical protein
MSAAHEVIIVDRSLTVLEVGLTAVEGMTRSYRVQWTPQGACNEGAHGSEF